MKIGHLRAVLSLAFLALLLVALGTANAADKWILLGQKVLKSTDPSTEIQGEDGKTFKEDVDMAIPDTTPLEMEVWVYSQ